MKYKCAIIDDENLAIDVIVNYLKSVDNLELVAKCNNGIEANNFLNNNHVDLLFLDIDMPVLTGLELLKNVPDPPSVIFTTAHRKYALDGFNYEAIDFLLKPISFERFLKAINKFLKMKKSDLINATIENRNYIQKDKSEFIFFKLDKKMVRIYVEDMIYIESIRNNIKIVTKDREYVIRKSLSEIEERLLPPAFLRIHRSFIIAVNKIDEYSTSHVKLGEYTLNIGRNYRSQVVDFLGKYANSPDRYLDKK